jgi:hypothetical protein
METEQDLKKAAAVRQAYAEAIQMKKDGVSQSVIRETIEKKLIDRGLNKAAASIIAENLPGVHQERAGGSRSGKQNVMMGSGLLFAGILVTIIADAAALPKGGWYYFTFLGMMFAGIGFLINGVVGYKSEL